ncbi:MAG: fibronectin type III domain-containing protein [Thermoplasmata archaeon]
MFKHRHMVFIIVASALIFCAWIIMSNDITVKASQGTVQVPPSSYNSVSVGNVNAGATIYWSWSAYIEEWFGTESSKYIFNVSYQKDPHVMGTANINFWVQDASSATYAYRAGISESTAQMTVAVSNTYYLFFQNPNSYSTVYVQYSFNVYSSPPPAAPTNLKADAGDSRVTLSWSPSSGASTYNIYKWSGQAWIMIARGGTVTSYTDKSVVNGVAYYYAVSAVNSGGLESVLSNYVTAVPKTSVGSGNTPGFEFLPALAIIAGVSVVYLIERKRENYKPGG